MNSTKFIELFGESCIYIFVETNDTTNIFTYKSGLKMAPLNKYSHLRTLDILELFRSSFMSVI